MKGLDQRNQTKHRKSAKLPEIIILISHGDRHGVIHGVIHEVSHEVGLEVSQQDGDVHLCFLLEHLALKQCSL